jgi:serine/threonine protein phosphatase 1
VAARTLAIGDIHGCDVAFLALVRGLSIRPEDTVVVLGDAIDRGPGSRQVMERLVQLQHECRLVFILGNHEQMLLEGLENEQMAQVWLLYGGKSTLISYGGDPRNIPAAHLDFLRAAPNYWETDSDLFIHANIDPALPLEQQEADLLRWAHLTGDESPHPTGKRIVCGHTPQRSGVPLTFPGWVCIDTFICGGGWLTCLDVITNEYCQANTIGQLRFGQIETERK